MWPFNKTSAIPRRVERRLADLELEMADTRDVAEKTYAALKRMQGKLYQRAKVAESEEVPDTVADSRQLELPQAGAIHVQPDKALLRRRAQELRRR